jgi:hypothetical protein
VQLAIYVTTGGYLRVWHTYVNNSFETTRRWTTLDHAPLPTNEWTRLTVQLNYLGGGLELGGELYSNDKFFRVSINGGDPIASPYAYQSNQLTITDPQVFETNGTWFLMVYPTLNLGDGNQHISSVEVRGTGWIDDYVITNGDVLAATPVRWTIEATAGANGSIYPAGTADVPLRIPDGDDVTFTITPDPTYAIADVVVDGQSEGATNEWTFTNVTNDHTIAATFMSGGPQYSANGVPYSWFDAFGLDPADEGDDPDGDGAFTWEEYVAGTIPTNKASAFMVLDVVVGTTSNMVSFYGTDDSGVTRAFSMLRSTDLTDVNNWIMVATDAVGRAVSGTNIWWDVNPPAESPVLYRPTVIWP